VDELIFRPYASSDATTVADMMNAIEVACGAYPYYSPGDIAGKIATEITDLAQDTLVALEPDGRLVAAASVGAPSAGGSRARLDGGVHPEHRGRGIGRTLLAWQIDRAAALRAQQAPQTPWTLLAGASVADESAARLLERFGFRPVRYFIEMARPTADPPQAGLPDGLTSVAYSAEYLTAVYDAHMDAFSDHWDHQPRTLAKWAARTVESAAFRPDLSRLALHADQVVGYVLGYDNPGSHLLIGQVGTRGPWRKQGLASALLAETLAAAASAGVATAALGVDADSPTRAADLYERLGFVARYSPFAAYNKMIGPVHGAGGPSPGGGEMA
jgi:GNAT superfamily N-acetyltransferase